MRRLSQVRVFAAVVAAFACAAIAAGGVAAATSHSTRLTPAEQKWITPLLKVWEAQNAGLSLVLGQAAKPNAFLLGSKPNNTKLQTILGALLSCKKPKDAIKVAGPPPTKRLQAFAAALDAACIQDEKGAHAFARAMVTGTANQGTLTAALIKQGVSDFTLGSAQVKKVYKLVTAIGGRL